MNVYDICRILFSISFVFYCSSCKYIISRCKYNAMFLLLLLHNKYTYVFGLVRWMCGVSLKDRRCSEDLCNLLGINCVADVVRHGRLR